MRTTVDLPPAVHLRAVQIAQERGLSLSAVVAELAARGLIETGAVATIERDARSGFPVVSVVRPVTADDLSYVDADLDHVRGHRQMTDAYLASLTSTRPGAAQATLDTALADARPDTVILLPEQ